MGEIFIKSSLSAGWSATQKSSSSDFLAAAKRQRFNLELLSHK